MNIYYSSHRYARNDITLIPHQASEMTLKYYTPATSKMTLNYYSTASPALMLIFTDTSTLHVFPRSLVAIYTNIFYRIMAVYVRNDGKLQPLALPMARNRLVMNHSASMTHILPIRLHRPSSDVYSLNRFSKYTHFMCFCISVAGNTWSRIVV